MTVLDTIKGSMRLIGALAPGEEPEAHEAQDALAVLRELLESWSADRLLVYRITREAYALTAGQGSYTIGTSDPPADIAAPRPIRVERAGLIDGAAESSMTLLDADGWARVAHKSDTGKPQALYYEAAVPLGLLWLHPIPDSAYYLALYHWQELTAPPELTDEWLLPAGYARAIRQNLALALAAEYGRPVEPPLAAAAMESLALIRSLNAPAPVLECEPYLVDRGWRI